jgi:hypothetical protein
VIPPPSGKPELAGNEADEADQLLQIQLEQNRAQWTKERGRYRALRSFSFFFLFAVIAGGLIGLFFVLSRFQH